MKRIGLAFMSAIMCSFLFGCTSWEQQKENYERRKNPDAQAEMSLLRAVARTASDDLNEIKGCLLRETSVSSSIDVSGEYKVEDGFLFPLKMNTSNTAIVGTFDGCAKNILNRKRQNLGSGILHHAERKKRDFNFTFEGTLAPDFKGTVRSTVHEFTETF